MPPAHRRPFPEERGEAELYDQPLSERRVDAQDLWVLAWELTFTESCLFRKLSGFTCARYAKKLYRHHHYLANRTQREDAALTFRLTAQAELWP